MQYTAKTCKAMSKSYEQPVSPDAKVKNYILHTAHILLCTNKYYATIAYFWPVSIF